MTSDGDLYMNRNEGATNYIDGESIIPNMVITYISVEHIEQNESPYS